MPTKTTAAHGFSVLEIGAGWFPEFAAGAEKVFYHLFQALHRTGLSVRGIVPGSCQVRTQSGGRVVGFAARSAPLAKRLWSARKAIVQAFDVDPPDLVAAHFALFALPGLDCLERRPLVVHFHGPWAAESRFDGAGWLSWQVKQTIERIVYQRAAKVIALSDAFAGHLERIYRVDPARIVVIPGGVDCARFAVQESRTEARRRLGWPADRATILTVRRLAKRMGLRELIASMAGVRRAVPDVYLVVAGRGELAQELERQVEDLDLRDTVKLIGFVPDELLPLAYHAADLTIVPSQELEGFGLITAESLAAGTPVLVTPVGGLPETVAALSPELVLEGSRTIDLSTGLTEALKGRRNLPSGKRCRAYAVQCFDWSVIAAQTRAIYHDALHP